MPRYQRSQSDTEQTTSQVRPPEWPKHLIDRGFQEGQIVEANVRRVTPAGLVLTVDQTPAFLHRGSLSKDDAEDLQDFKRGDRLKARLSRYDAKREQLFLSRWNLPVGDKHVRSPEKLAPPPPPNDALTNLLVPGSRVHGRITERNQTNITVELASGHAGTIPLEDYLKTHSHLEHTAHDEQGLEVWISAVHQDSHRLDLTLEPEWWMEAGQLRLDEDLSGTVLSVSDDCGVQVNLGALTGWIAPHELSWSRPFLRPSDVVKIDQVLSVKVMAIDLHTERIQLSLRRSSAGIRTWKELAGEIRKGQVYKGAVSYAVAGAGMEVDLGKLSGWVPFSEFAARAEQPGFSVGQVTNVIVRGVDRDNQRILLGIPRPNRDAALHRLHQGVAYSCNVVQVANTAVWVRTQDVRGVILSESLKASGLGHPRERFHVGDTIDAVFRRYDNLNEVAVFTLDPRRELEQRGLSVGQVCEARVASIHKNHILVEASGVIGTVARTQISWDAQEQDTSTFMVDDPVTVKITRPNPAHPNPIQMSIRQADREGWRTLLQGLAVGELCSARIVRADQSGITVNVRGLTHQIPRALLPDPATDPTNEFVRDQVIEPRITAIEEETFYLGLSLNEEDDPKVAELAQLIARDESKSLEFKSTFRLNEQSGKSDKKRETAVLKNIVAMMNTDGGHVLVGLRNKTTPIGIAVDNFEDGDQMMLHLRLRVNERIGEEVWDRVHPEVQPYHDVQLLVIRCDRSEDEVFLDGRDFFIRQGPAASVLTGPALTTYVKKRASAMTASPRPPQ